MSDFDNLEDLFEGDDGYDTVVMKGENGEDVEFLILDVLQKDDTNYLLVINSDDAENEEAEAVVLKEIVENESEVFYDILEDGEEFQMITELLQQNDDYDIEL